MPLLLLDGAAGVAGVADARAWLLALLSVGAVGLLSLLGAVAFVVRREVLDRVLPYLVSVAVGSMLGAAFLHLLPDLAADGLSRRDCLLILAGMVTFFVFERYVHWHQHGHSHGHAAVAPYAWMTLAGDALHNFADGVIIAATYVTSPALGLTTTLAVALHEVPQEIGDMGVLLQGRLSRRRALLLSLATGAVALAGAVVGLVLGGRVAGFTEGVLAVTAGGFVYIAAADLMPELHREARPAASLLQVACLVLGVAVMAALD